PRRRRVARRRRLGPPPRRRGIGGGLRGPCQPCGARRGTPLACRTGARSRSNRWPRDRVRDLGAQLPARAALPGLDDSAHFPRPGLLHLAHRHTRLAARAAAAAPAPATAIRRREALSAARAAIAPGP